MRWGVPVNSSQRLFVVATAGVLVAATGGALIHSLTIVPDVDEDRLSVVATFYPLAYFAEQIGGNHVRVRTLIPHNAELHAVDFSTGDLVAVQEAGIFIYNGAGLEPWVEERLLPAVDTRDIIVVEATHGVRNQLLEYRSNGPLEVDHGLGKFDPHTWVDPVLAMAEAEAVLTALKQADPLHADDYDANAATLFARLETVRLAYEVALANAGPGAIIVAHDAFGYLGQRYGFDVIGIIGLSADEQPSAASLTEIVTRMMMEGIYTLYVTPVYSDEYVGTLKSTLEQETGETVTVLPLYILTGPADGKDFVEQMEANLASLEVGFGG